MSGELQILIVEDSDADASLILHELRLTGRAIESARVEDGPTLRDALLARPWDVVISDVLLPRFSAREVLDLITVLDLDVPCIIVSGMVGEEVAVETMRAGAKDYLMRDQLTRLVPAVEREVARATERRQQRNADARFRALVERSRDLIVLVGADGDVIYASPAVTKILGLEPETIVGMPAIELIHPADRARVGGALAEMISDPSKSVDLELRVLHRDGSTRWLEATGRNLLADPSVAAMVGNLRDITERRRAEDARDALVADLERELAERKRAEAALKKSEDELRQAQKMEAIGRLAGGVAHDFNNMLSVILSYSEILALNLRPDDPMRADLDGIHAAGRRAAELTRQLLAFSRQQVLAPRVIDLNEVLLELEKMLRRVIGEDVELVIASSVRLGTVLADQGQFEQVMMNLVVNARDAMPAGGKLTIETSNAILDGDVARNHLGLVPGPHVVISVTDNGVGMDPATKARIFEPFFTTKEKGRGTGLGLSTALGIVQQSGGTIWVDSEPGRGTTFKIYLPRVDSVRTEDIRAHEASRRSTAPGSETILLVEDDDGVRSVCIAILRKQGYQVLEAHNGGEALLICEQHADSIDLLLTDVVMPRISGRQLADRLRNLRPELRVLFMSGYTSDSITYHDVLAPGIAYLQKPITPETLSHKVREVLDS